MMVFKPVASMENEASSKPTAQPMKPIICSLIRPYLSARNQGAPSHCFSDDVRKKGLIKIKRVLRLPRLLPTG